MSVFAFIAILCVFVVAIVVFCDFCVIQAGNDKYKTREDDEIQTIQYEVRDDRRIESWENFEKKENAN